MLYSIYSIAPNFCGLKFCDFHEIFLNHENFIHKNFFTNAWLVDEEVSVLGTNNSQNLGRFTKQKFTLQKA